MPQGIFSAPSKKGSSSKGAGVKTSFLIFQRTDKGGTDKVWFYNMLNDGFSLDAKRLPIDKCDIPDLLNRFNHLEEEHSRSRTEQSFMVPVEEIRQNGYNLTFNKYSEITNEKKNYRSTEEILDDIEKLNDEVQTSFARIKDLLG